MKQSQTFNRIAGLALATLVTISVVLSTGCGKKGGADGDKAANAAPPSTPVDVAPVALGNISQLLNVVGSLQSLYSVNLSPKTAGRLIAVNVREGDPVTRGEVVARIDPVEAQSQVAQDEANVLNAKAKLDQAVSQYNKSKITYAVGVLNAKASLASAKITLQKTIAGDQPQQKAQAVAQLAQQQANYQNALNNLNRQKQLYAAGAIAKADMDTAQTNFDVQDSQLEYYKQNLSLIQQGGRPEDIETQRQIVVQDQENLRSAYAGQADVDVNKQGVEAAQAYLVQQQQLLVAAKQALADTSIVSPIDGVVAQRSADPGVIAQPGTTVLQIVDLSTMYYQPTVSETDLRNIAVGQQVSISVDAFPGHDFIGKVTDVFPSASSADRQFSLRVSVPNSEKILRPGMYARGSIVIERHTNVVVVPTSALLPRTSDVGFEANSSSTGLATGNASMPPQKVFVAGDDNKAKEVDVEIGIVNGNNAEVVSGLSVGDQLIVKGQGQIQDGDSIKIAKPGGHHVASTGAVSSDNNS